MKVSTNYGNNNKKTDKNKGDGSIKDGKITDQAKFKSRLRDLKNRLNKESYNRKKNNATTQYGVRVPRTGSDRKPLRGERLRFTRDTEKATAHLPTPMTVHKKKGYTIPR